MSIIKKYTWAGLKGQTLVTILEAQGDLKVLFFPSPPLDRGKGGDTPHPAKGLPPLGSLLCSTFK